MSNLETSEEMREYPSLPHEFLWNLLASTEQRFGLNLGLRERFVEMCADSHSPVLRFQRTWFLIENRFKTAEFGDLTLLFESLSADMCREDPMIEEVRSLAVYETKTGKERPEQPTPEVKLKTLHSLLLAALVTIETRNLSVLDFVRGCRKALGAASLMDAETQRILDGIDTMIAKPSEDLLPALQGQTDLPGETRVFAATRLAKPDAASPNTLFYAHMILFDFFRQSTWRQLIEPDLERIVVGSWNHVVRHQSFLLQAPRRCGPVIQSLCSDDTHGWGKVARILLAAFSGVNVRIPTEMVSCLRSMASQNQPLAVTES